MTAHARGTTVVVATHDPALLKGGRRRVVVLEGGRVVHDAPAFADDGINHDHRQRRDLDRWERLERQESRERRAVGDGERAA